MEPPSGVLISVQCVQIPCLVGVLGWPHHEVSAPNRTYTAGSREYLVDMLESVKDSRHAVQATSFI